MLSGAANDLGSALGTIDTYTGKAPNVTGVNVLVKVHRGTDQAFIRTISLPARVRAGSRVKVKVTLQVVRGARLTRTYTLTIPRDARSGRQTLRLVGQDADQGDDAFTTIILGDDDEENEGGDPGPATLDDLAERSRRPSASTACRCASAALAARRSATTTTASPARPRRLRVRAIAGR